MCRLLLAALAVTLTACGGSGSRAAPFTPAAECVSDGGTRFELQSARACDFYLGAGDSLLAGMSGYVTTGSWSPADARALLDGLTVYVHDGTQFECAGDGGIASGCQWWGEPTPKVEVGETGGAALHEAFHAMQDHLGIDYQVSYDHEGWDRHGWLSEGDRFYWQLDSRFHAEFGGTATAGDGGTTIQ